VRTSFVTLALVVLAASGCRSQKKESSESPMTVSPLELAVAKQLIMPPPESEARLNAMEHGTPPPPYARGQATAAEVVRGWAMTSLKAPYRPPPGTEFVAFPAESGRFDVVRSRFVVMIGSEPTRLEVSSTRSVMGIGITPTPDERTLACRDRIQRVTERALVTGQWQLADGEVTFLDGGKPLDLIEQGVSGSLVYGAPRGPRAVPDPYWEQDLRWWCTPEEVGVVFLMGPGRPNPHSISWTLDDNAVWFSLYEQ
jgi:hypothetical protein